MVAGRLEDMGHMIPATMMLSVQGIADELCIIKDTVVSFQTYHAHWNKGPPFVTAQDLVCPVALSKQWITLW